MEPTEYERNAWREMQASEPDGDGGSPAWMEKVGRFGEAAGDRVRSLGGRLPTPGFRGAGRGLQVAAEGLGRMTADAAAATLSAERVLRHHRKHGVDAGTLREVRVMPLDLVDASVRRARLPLVYGLTGAAAGGGAAIMTTAGGVGALVGGVTGAGAGAAPGVGMVAASLTADAAAVFALNVRVVSHVALLYGYEPDAPGEQLFLLSVLNLGTAGTQLAKQAALRDLTRLSQALFRGANWAALSSSALTKVMQQFAKAYTVRLTRKKLGQIVPVAGVAVGAGANYATTSQVFAAATWAYRRRFLLDKYPQLAADLPSETADDGTPRVAGPDVEVDEALSVLDIVHEVQGQDADADPTPDVGSDRHGETSHDR